MRSCLAIAVLALAGCPPKSPQGGGSPPALTGPGCPPAAGVYLASYATSEPGKGRTGWVMQLHAMKIEPGAAVPDYAPLDAAAASASGVPPAPTGTLWLISAAGAPCRAQLGSYYGAKLEGPPASISYGVELQGCPAPTDPQEGEGLVMVANEAPTGCRFDSPHPVAQRLGQMDAQKQWQRPTTATPIPPALAAAIPPHSCQAPACEQLWAFAQIDENHQPVAWTGAVNWLAVGDPAAPCNWKAERFSGTFVPGPSGSAVRIDGRSSAAAGSAPEGERGGIDGGAEHPLALSAALVDTGGPRVLVTEGPGEYATYDLVGGKPTLGHHVTSALVPAEAWEAVDHLGPMCEPPAARPAPMPRDAKPVSPYP